jgi:hypothetical protein
MVRVERLMGCGIRDAFKARLQSGGFGCVLNTAFAERVNLTVPRGLATFARRGWSTTQTVSQLKDGFAWWRGNYHFVRTHKSLRVKLTVTQDRGGTATTTTVSRADSRDGRRGDE